MLTIELLWCSSQMKKIAQESRMASVLCAARRRVTVKLHQVHRKSSFMAGDPHFIKFLKLASPLNGIGCTLLA